MSIDELYVVQKRRVIAFQAKNGPSGNQPLCPRLLIFQGKEGTKPTKDTALEKKPIFATECDLPEKPLFPLFGIKMQKKSN